MEFEFQKEVDEYIDRLDAAETREQHDAIKKEASEEPWFDDWVCYVDNILIGFGELARRGIFNDS